MGDENLQEEKLNYEPEDLEDQDENKVQAITTEELKDLEESDLLLIGGGFYIMKGNEDEGYDLWKFYENGSEDIQWCPNEEEMVKCINELIFVREFPEIYDELNTSRFGDYF